MRTQANNQQQQQQQTSHTTSEFCKSLMTASLGNKHTMTVIETLSSFLLSY